MKTSLALLASTIALSATAQHHKGDNFAWNIESADQDWTIETVDFEAKGAHKHTWGPNEDITVTISGQVNKHITAGTTKWEVYGKIMCALEL